MLAVTPVVVMLLVCCIMQAQCLPCFCLIHAVTKAGGTQEWSCCWCEFRMVVRVVPSVSVVVFVAGQMLGPSKSGMNK
eukprot:scaffold209839_cov21-Tisochrysis_lutea.AAC.5